MDQKRIPVFNMLKSYESENTVPFHMPGHKMGNGLKSLISNINLKWDITEINGSDNLQQPDGVIMQAERLAAEAYDAKRTFFLVNGASSGIIAMILSALKPGEKLLIPRNCHKSVINAAMIGRIKPVYIMPEYDNKHDMFTGLSTEKILKAVDNDKDIKAVLITYPNYYGMCCDICEISDELHKRGKLLLADEAHGAHFIFSRLLPVSCSEAGADIWVDSAHKTLPSLTQSAFLSIGKNSRIDDGKVQRFINMIQTTSPSYLLMMSLDMSRYIMANYGEKSIEKVLNAAEIFRNEINSTGILYCFGNEWTGTPGVRYFDGTRIVIDIRNTGHTGYEIDRILRKEYHIQVEMADLYHIVCIVTVSDDLRNLKILRDSLMDIVEKSCLNDNGIKSDDNLLNMSYTDFISEYAMKPSDVFDYDTIDIDIRKSAGKISYSSIGLYPPGIPLVNPGEKISKKTVDYIKYMESNGAEVFGYKDSIEKTVTVLDI